ncbi:hypothetical protein KKC83_05100 [Patescibacteria group bacterium]|nr:hypothetical protein [Candidatus Falkowbacteria bacterium]MBU3906290.1 hypothetical protein [Patescibacteria group bacterium]MBU4015337.1 hypothetical protein [Patescibacteria group bacterium]MBU4026895.1 hypothetical protein [Patescibacteria group bacterium]MBU4072918.1 hypothetical protein [Patescibacteria group bacterium]
MFKKILFLTIISTLLIAPWLAINGAEQAGIILNQQEFKPGDEARAKIVFVNNFSEQFTGRLFCDFTSLIHRLPPMPYVEEIDLAPGQSKTMDCSMAIAETMPEGVWRVEATVKDRSDNIISGSYKEFLVAGTKKEINADLLVCADVNCENNKAVFIAGETVYLKINSGITDMRINAQTQNSKTKDKQAIDFINNIAQIKSEQEGSFIINLTLNKSGYSEQAIQKNFAVIGAPAKIKSASVCSADGVCVSPETVQNCPQDCVQAKAKIISAKIIIFIASALVIILIMAAAYYFLIRRTEI